MQLWTQRLSADGEHVAAVAATSFGSWTVLMSTIEAGECRSMTWCCRECFCAGWWANHGWSERGNGSWGITVNSKKLA